VCVCVCVGVGVGVGVGVSVSSFELTDIFSQNFMLQMSHDGCHINLVVPVSFNHYRRIMNSCGWSKMDITFI
jgi:hypothetical protein